MLNHGGEKLQEVEKNNYMRWRKLEKRIKMQYKTDTVTGIRLKRFMKMIWTLVYSSMDLGFFLMITFSRTTITIQSTAATAA